MYVITIKIPNKRIGVINKVKKVLKDSYETASIKNRGIVTESILSKAGSMKEVGITFEVKECES